MAIILFLSVAANVSTASKRVSFHQAKAQIDEAQGWLVTNPRSVEIGESSASNPYIVDHMQKHCHAMQLCQNLNNQCCILLSAACVNTCLKLCGD